MLKYLCRVLCGLALLPAIPGFAAVNYQDMWWQPTESGWGLMVLNQEDTISAVLFHYGADRKPVWYLLSNASRGAGESFTGVLFETAGPPLFGVFDPNLVSTREAGTMTINFQSLTAANLSYTIDGESTNRDIERITFSNIDSSGTYIGSQSGYASCASFPQIDTFTFSSNIEIGANPPIRASLGASLLGVPMTCDFDTAPAQSGGIFSGSGSWVCKDATNTTLMMADYVIDEMRIIDKTLVMNFHATTNYPTVPATCTERGTFSGVKR